MKLSLIPLTLVICVMLAVVFYPTPVQEEEALAPAVVVEEVPEPAPLPYPEERRIMAVLDSAVMLNDVEITDPVPIEPFAGTRDSFGRFCATSIYSGIDASVYDSPGFAEAWELRGMMQAFRTHVFSYPLHRTRTLDWAFVSSTYPAEIWAAIEAYQDATDAILAEHPGEDFWDQEYPPERRALADILTSAQNENLWYIEERLEHWR